MIEEYLTAAKRKITIQSKHLILALCCTHFQFAESIFKEIAQDIFEANIIILNPNEAMSKVVQLEQEVHYGGSGKLIHKMISNMEIYEEEISTIGAAIQGDAPGVYLALKNYQLTHNT